MNQVKHPGWILALHRSYFTVALDCLPGLNRQISFSQFVENASGFLIAARREELESNEDYRQILPYTVILREDADGVPSEVFVYQRTKGVGEARLAGNTSIGFGGHMDLIDVVRNKDSVIDLRASISMNTLRENVEEIKVVDKDHPRSGGGIPLMYLSDKFIQWGLHPMRYAGILLDDTNSVGKVHVGVIQVIVVKAGTEITCREESLIPLGFFPITHLVEGEETTEEEAAIVKKRENWTRILLEHGGWHTSLDGLFDEVKPSVDLSGIDTSPSNATNTEWKLMPAGPKEMIRIQPLSMSEDQAKQVFHGMKGIIDYIEHAYHRDNPNQIGLNGQLTIEQLKSYAQEILVHEDIVLETLQRDPLI